MAIKRPAACQSARAGPPGIDASDRSNAPSPPLLTSAPFSPSSARSRGGSSSRSPEKENASGVARLLGDTGDETRRRPTLQLTPAIAAAINTAAAARAESCRAENEWKGLLETILLRVRDPVAAAAARQAAKQLAVRSARHGQRLRAALLPLEHLASKFGEMHDRDLAALDDRLHAQHTATADALARELRCVESQVDSLKREKHFLQAALADAQQAVYERWTCRDQMRRAQAAMPSELQLEEWMRMCTEAREGSLEARLDATRHEADTISQHADFLASQSEASRRSNSVLTTSVAALSAALSHERIARAREREEHRLQLALAMSDARRAQISAMQAEAQLEATAAALTRMCLPSTLV